MGSSEGEPKSPTAGTPVASQQGHYWEEAVFPGSEVPNREKLKYSGLLQRQGREPVFLAAVKGHDLEGQPFHWGARRHRKRVRQHHECARPPPPISWLGWLDVRRHAHKPGWWLALLYAVGSVLFVGSGAAGEVRAVAEPATKPPGLPSLHAGLLSWPNVVAANLFFFPGGIIQLIESTGQDVESRVRAWEKGGRQGPRPRHRLRPHWADLRGISWWGSVIQLAGMLGFNLATIFSVIKSARELKASVKSWTIHFGFTFGGAAFTVAAVLFCWEATGSLWRGVVPSSLADLKSISWLAAFWNFHGSVGFLIGGAAEYAADFSWTQTAWMEGYGSLCGALWFLLGSLAALLEQANPRHP